MLLAEISRTERGFFARVKDTVRGSRELDECPMKDIAETMGFRCTRRARGCGSPVKSSPPPSSGCACAEVGHERRGVQPDGRRASRVAPSRRAADGKLAGLATSKLVGPVIASLLIGGGVGAAVTKVVQEEEVRVVYVDRPAPSAAPASQLSAERSLLDRARGAFARGEHDAGDPR
jgi:hypothetical protein